MSFITCLEDGGRKASKYPDEKLDCTVRAWAIIKGIPYDQAHFEVATCRKNFRKAYGFEFWLRRQRLYVRALGRRTVGKFLKENRKGRFIVSVRGHVFAVIDGRPFDLAPVRLRQRIKYIAEVSL